MESVGDAYDNAMIESFWGTIKIELLCRQTWATGHKAEMAIFERIDAGTTGIGCTPHQAGETGWPTSSTVSPDRTSWPGRGHRGSAGAAHRHRGRRGRTIGDPASFEQDRSARCGA